MSDFARALHVLALEMFAATCIGLLLALVTLERIL